MITTAEAFAGPWALNARGWVWALVPAGGVVVLQELSTPGLTAGGIVASVLLQLAAVVVWSIAVVGVSRLRFDRVVPVASALLWVGNGVFHGLVGGAVAATAGLDPEWGYRFVFWIVATVTWMPLITYGLAQWDEHRSLLAERARLADEVALAVARGEEDVDARARRFTAALATALDPALHEIRAQLRENGAGIDADTAHEIAVRLDALAQQTERYTRVAPVEPPAEHSSRVSVADASVNFELSRPVFAALLSAALIAVPLLAEAYRGDGWPGAGVMAIAIAVATGVLATVFGILRPLRFTGAQRSRWSRVGVVAAGLVGAATLLVLGHEDPQPHDIALVIVFPVLQMLSASLTATAVALWAANVDTDAHVAADAADLERLQERSRIAEEQTAARLQTLVRGEVNGRLAACAMLLAFLADGGGSPDSRGEVVAKVLDQLDAAARELQTS